MQCRHKAGQDPEKSRMQWSGSEDAGVGWLEVSSRARVFCGLPVSSPLHVTPVLSADTDRTL